MDRFGKKLDLQRGGQKLPGMKPKVEKKIFFYQGEKWNNKLGGRSFVITCGAFGHGLLHRAQLGRQDKKGKKYINPAHFVKRQH